MKKIESLFIIAMMIFNIFCSSEVYQKKHTLKKCKISSELDSVLLKVIEKEKDCSFFVQDSSFFSLDFIINDSIKRLNISSIHNRYNYNLMEYKGYFFIDEYLFLSNLTDKDKLVKVTDEVKVFKYSFCEDEEFIFNDDRLSAWYFDILDEELSFLGYYPCAK